MFEQQWSQFIQVIPPYSPFVGTIGYVAGVFDFFGFKPFEKFLIRLEEKIFFAAADPKQLELFVYCFGIGQ
jgi:hypothetical protein